MTYSPRAWYSAAVASFLTESPDAIVGRLATNCDFDIVREQTDAWRVQIDLLKAQLADRDGLLLLEFNIPRMGRRIDAVLVQGPVVFVIEFKVGAIEFDRAAVDQVWDYALDVKNFHEASHQLPIVPILIATEAAKASSIKLNFAADRVAEPLLLQPGALRTTLERIAGEVTGDAIDAGQWALAPYRRNPDRRGTPCVVRQNSVTNCRDYAGQNLSRR